MIGLLLPYSDPTITLLSQDPLQRALQLLDSGDPGSAALALQRAFPKALSSLPHLSVACAVYQATGEYDKAAFYARQATQVAPKEADVWANLGLVLAADPRGRTKDLNDAISAYTRAQELDPASANIATGYANALMRARRYSEAIDVCERAASAGATPALITTHASLLAAVWRTEEAVSLLRDGLARYPDESTLLHALLVNLQVLSGQDPSEIARLHARLGAWFEQRVEPMCIARPTHHDKERPLRVGFLSPDLRRHSVAYFALPLFAHLPREEFQIHAYSLSPVRDEMTEALRAHTHGWVDASALSDDAIASRIAADRIDVLVDLAGLSQGGRLGVLARRPAPLQATYCGYPDTTGLSRVGLRIIDAITDPPGLADARATERLVRISPCFLCYQAPADAPPVSVRGADAPIVFGSFNTIRKINTFTLDLWTRVLGSVPGSRLAIKSLDLDIPAVQSRFRDELARRGLSDRVDVLPPARTTREHLDLYARVDVGLDPFPYHGTTTTCEALWMGVPVVTLLGKTHHSRVSASLLSAIGRDRWIAGNESEYISIARSLAVDRAAYAHERASLRERVARSPLCDARTHGAAFGAALREEWRSLCTRQG